VKLLFVHPSLETNIFLYLYPNKTKNYLEEMNKSLAHLSEERQHVLQNIVEQILLRLPDTQMIILYGSYARGDYVEYDQRVEFGVPTYFMSDYDILVLTHGVDYNTVTRHLDEVEYWYSGGSERWVTPLQFIHDNIGTMNRDLSDGRYFYTDIKKEGIVLYDSGNFKLEKPRKLRFDEIKAQAQEYYDEKYDYAFGFFEGTGFYYSKERYKLASFELHQAAENAFKTVRLVYTLYSSKEHDLEKLLKLVKGYAPEEYFNLFPRQTEEEKRLFELLRAAYIEARYNPKFLVTKEDLDALIPIVEQLLELTKRLCEARIKAYDEMK